MKTFAFSFFVLYAIGNTEATHHLRSTLAALHVYDEREHNAPWPTPEPLPVLPPTENSHFESNSIHNHYEPPSFETQPKTYRHSSMTSHSGG